MDSYSSPPRAYWPTTDWHESEPGAHGLDLGGLADAFHYLRAHVPHIDSLLVVRGGDLVYERYAPGAGPDALRNVKSMTKSVLSTLVGIALHTGDLESIHTPVVYLLPEAFVTLDVRAKRDITVRHLLAMRSGLDWAEYGASALQMTASPDWVSFVLERPLAHPPGEVFNYSTGDSQLLAAVLQRVTGMTLLDFADLYLFGPLGISRRAWPADPQGVTIGGAELMLTPRDMAKFGFMVLNRGEWDGDRVVPAAWLDEATSYMTTFAPRSASDCDVLGYGYLWWLRPQGGYDSAIAVGYGGQFVYVIPELDLVVVMTGRLQSAPDTFRDNRMLCHFNLVEDFIVPAVARA